MTAPRLLTPAQQSDLDGYMQDLRNLFSQIYRRVNVPKVALSDVDTIAARVSLDSDTQLQTQLDALDAKFTALYQTVGLTPQYIDECEKMRALLGLPLRAIARQP
jgi:hypothetical protein